MSKSKTYKPKVVFAFVEAGMGHIAPERSIADAFEKKYGKYTRVVRSHFFSESGKKPLIRFEKMLCNNVRMYNRMPFYGYLSLSVMHLLGPQACSELIMNFIPHANKYATEYVDELKADMFLSTHWATAYYVANSDSKPINVSYVPDVEIIPLCCYPNDMTLVSAKSGYDSALKHYPKRFNKDNLALVPFAIRKEAFSVPLDKNANRKALGLDENRFTVVLFDGGYGIGKMGKVAELLAKSDMNITVVPICGKNVKLYEKLKAVTPSPSVDFRVLGFTDRILEYLGAADLFMGKSGASSVAEPCFFGVPEIITSYATQMEQHNAHYYIDHVGNALAIFNPKKAAEKVRFFYDNPQELEKLAEKARAHHDNYGAEQTADIMWELLKKKFPELAEEEKKQAQAEKSAPKSK